MRAQEIYEKLISARIADRFSNFDQADVVFGIQDLRNRLEKLQGIDGFGEVEAKLQGSILFRTNEAQIKIPRPEWSDLGNTLGEYQRQLVGLQIFLSAQLSLQNAEAVYVKLPMTMNFRQAIESQDRVAKVLEQVVFLKGVDGRLELKSWEKGSLWLELLVGGQAVVAIVGSLAWAAAVVYKKVQEGRLHAEYVNGLKLKNDHIKAIVDAEGEMLKQLVDTEAKNIASQHIQGEVDAETIERIKFSIKELSKLIEGGTEIHASLKAPEDVKNLFPDFKKLGSISSRTKLLQEGAQEAKT